MDFLNLHTYGYLFVWFIIYSFFGWVYESLWQVLMRDSG